jgi:hypothetical protein
MKFLLGKAKPKRLNWPIVTLLLSATLVQAACLERKTLRLDMSWKRGDNHYGPDFIGLESACLGSSEPSCFCSVNFKVTRSRDFADYIESFGSKKVPVKYRVDYDQNHQVVGAILESVGTWPGAGFHDDERSLSTGFRMVPGQTKGGGRFRNPGDCFPGPMH